MCQMVEQCNFIRKFYTFLQITIGGEKNEYIGKLHGNIHFNIVSNT
jgi:hypothetical protein